MSTEYGSCIIAAAMLFWLPQTNAFQITGDIDAEIQTNISGYVLLKLVFIQTLPELVVDTFCCFAEVRGGLTNQYKEYWGGVDVSTVAMKLVMSAALVAVSLGATIINR